MTMTRMNRMNHQDDTMLYQVDCCKASSGKTVALTKRRIRWRFGHANPSAISNGLTGVDCRGSEHEITLVWSITSGKKLIIHDSTEVHYSQGRRAEGKFQFSWQSKMHVFTLIAHAAPPMGKGRSHWKQFDLLIDGCSFDDLPRIYQLGSTSSSVSSADVAGGPSPRSFARPPVHNSYEYPMEPRNERSIRDEMTWARSIHTIETRRQMNVNADVNVVSRQNSDSTMRDTSTPSPVQTLDLISDDYVSDSPQDLLSQPVPLTKTVFNPVSVSNPHYGNNSSNSVTSASTNPFEYQQDDHFNPQKPPTYEAIWSNIMDAYDSNAQDDTRNTMMVSPTNSVSNIPVVDTSVSNIPMATNLTINTNPESYMPHKNVVSPTDVTELDGAMKNLVNLDDISQPVLKGYIPKNVNDTAGKENLSLRDLKKEPKAPKTEVMRSYAAYTQSNPGAMVVYGQPQQVQQQGYSNYGPPPPSFGYGVPTYSM